MPSPTLYSCTLRFGKTHIKLIKHTQVQTIWQYLEQFEHCSIKILLIIINPAAKLWKESNFAMMARVFDIKLSYCSTFPSLKSKYRTFAVNGKKILWRREATVLLYCFRHKTVKNLTLCVPGQRCRGLLPHLGYLHGHAAPDCAGGRWKPTDKHPGWELIVASQPDSRLLLTAFLSLYWTFFLHVKVKALMYT